MNRKGNWTERLWRELSFDSKSSLQHLTVNQACSNWLRQKAFNLVPMNNHVFRQKAFNFLPMNNLFIVPKTLADAIFFVTPSQHHAFFLLTPPQLTTTISFFFSSVTLY